MYNKQGKLITDSQSSAGEPGKGDDYFPLMYKDSTGCAVTCDLRLPLCALSKLLSPDFLYRASSPLSCFCAMGA